MAKLVKLQTQQNMLYTPPSSDYVLVATGLDSQGNVTQLVKKSDGTFVSIGGGGGSSAVLGMVDAQGKFQALSFDGTTASNSGDPVEVTSYYSWDGTLPVPQTGAKATAGYIVQNEDGTTSFIEVGGSTEAVAELYIPNTGVAEPAYTGQKIVEKTTEFYKCASVDTTAKTWSGYKAVLGEDGMYTFEETVTEGLSYGVGFTPVVGSVYDAEARITVSKLYGSVKIPEDFVFYDALTSSDGWTTGGGVQVSTDSSIGQSVFEITSGSGYFVKPTTENMPSGNAVRSMSFWFRKSASSISQGWAGIGYGSGNATGVRYTFGVKENYPVFSLWATDYFQTSSGLIEDNNWHHYTATYDGTSIVLYCDSVVVFSWNPKTTLNTILEYVHVGDYYENSYAPIGCFSSLRIYDRVLSATEIEALASEFTPTT